MVALVGILVVIILIIFLNWCYKIYKRNKQLEKIPGPWPVPFLGYQLPTNVFDLKCMFDDLFGKYGKTCKLYIGESLHVVTCDAELIEEVMKSNVHTTKSRLYNLARPWLKDGLIVSAGDKWRQRRKMITPSFHFSVLKDFFTLFKTSTETLIKRFGEQADKDVEIDAREFISKVSFEVIAESAFGIKMNIQNGERIDYIESVDSYTELLFKRAFSIWKRFNILFKLFSGDFKIHKNSLKIIDGMSRTIIQTKRDQYENSMSGGNLPEIKKNTILIDQLMRNAKLTDDAVLEEINNFLFAGYDTTSSALSFTLFELSKHLDVQEKLYDEIQSTLNNDFSKLTKENLESMKYLDQVLKEMLRFRSPVPLIERSLQEDAKFGDIIYPKGTIISMLIYWLHRQEDYYPDPEKFDPERFNPDNPDKPRTFAFVPFSAGPRNCIGQKYAALEWKTLLTRIVMEFIIEPVVGAKLEIGLAAVLQSKYGFPIKLRRRHV